MSLCLSLAGLASLGLIVALFGESPSVFVIKTLVLTTSIVIKMGVIFFFLIIVELKLPLSWWSPTAGLVIATLYLLPPNLGLVLANFIDSSYGPHDYQLLLLGQTVITLVSLALCFYLLGCSKKRNAQTPTAAKFRLMDKHKKPRRWKIQRLGFYNYQST